jgi:hypothetical protein
MMKTNRIVMTAVTAALAMLANNAGAAIIATYNLAGAAGGEASSAAPTISGNVTATSITRGAGLTANAGGNSFNSANFATTFDATKYVQLGIAPTAGNSLTLNNLFFNTQRSNTGPATVEIRSSLDGYATTIATISPPASLAAQSVALPAAFSSLSSGVTFRLFGYSASGTSGTFRIAQNASNSTSPNAFSFDGSTAAVSTNAAPAVQPVGTTTVTFGSVVSAGAPFSVQVTATDANAADILTLAVGTLPAGVSGVTVTPNAGAVSPATFTVAGTVDYSTNQTTVMIPFTVSDGQGGSAPGSFALAVVPEPASLFALCGVASIAIRRRK